MEELAQALEKLQEELQSAGISDNMHNTPELLGVTEENVLLLKKVLNYYYLRGIVKGYEDGYTDMLNQVEAAIDKKEGKEYAEAEYISEVPSTEGE